MIDIVVAEEVLVALQVQWRDDIAWIIGIGGAERDPALLGRVQRRDDGLLAHLLTLIVESLSQARVLNRPLNWINLGYCMLSERHKKHLRPHNFSASSPASVSWAPEIECEVCFEWNVPWVQTEEQNFENISANRDLDETDILIFAHRVTIGGISDPHTHLLHRHDQNYQTFESQLHFGLSKQLNFIQSKFCFHSRPKSIHMRRFHSLVCYLSAEVQSSHLLIYFIHFAT